MPWLVPILFKGYGQHLQGNSPEDLLDSTGQRLGWVGSLSSCQTDELRSGVRESGSNEDTAETTEAVLERAWVMPEFTAPVLAVFAVLGTATAAKDNSDDHEDADGGKLEARTPEFFFGVTECSENVDDDNNNPE